MEGTPGAPQGASTLRHYVDVARRRKLIIIQGAVLAALAALALSFVQKPVYGASAEVLIKQQNLAFSLTGTADPSAAQPERVIETQVQLARTPAVAERALKRAKLTAQRTPAEFLAASGVSARKNADIIAFHVSDRDPAVAVALTNAYAREFSTYRRELDTASFARARSEVGARLKQLERQGLRSSELYATLADKEQQLKTFEALQTSNAFVVKEAAKAGKISPKPIKSVLLGLMLGIVLGTGLAFLWEALDTRVRSTDEITRELGLPLLARLPAPPASLPENALVMLEQPNSIHGEAFRILRTNLDFFNLERGARTVLLTSAVGQEGKSTTSANLAIALARAGQNVALVDLDLRRPKLHTLFGIDRSPGVSDVIFGRQELAPQSIAPGDAALRAEHGSLEIVPAGSFSSQAGEFVGSPALGDIIDELKERADIVLIDTAPILLVGDTMALSSRVDAVLLITRLNVVRRPLLRELRRVLDVCPAAKLGFVVTGAEFEDDYRYGYGGYYSYGSPAAKGGV